MYTDEFDEFVFHDATKRRGLKARDARARVDHHSAWIHHAIVRLGCAQSPAERRAAQREIEQDIRNIQARRGWDQQLMSAFHRRQQATQMQSPEAGPPGRPASAHSPT